MGNHIAHAAALRLAPIAATAGAPSAHAASSRSVKPPPHLASGRLPGPDARLGGPYAV